MKGSYFNPCGLNGFAFLEFSAPSPKLLHDQFEKMGFIFCARHKQLPLNLYQQGHIRFIINEIPNSQGFRHAQQHGAGACAMGFQVLDVEKAYAYAIAHGATPFQERREPAIQGIGGSAIYLVDQAFFDDGWEYTHIPTTKTDCGLQHIDHVTHNVYRGEMDKWADFYHNIFNFREIRFFNIIGKMTGLISRALSSPCNKIRIPLNESKDDHSQIEEFLQEYRGEGIQHIALSTKNIYNSVRDLRTRKVTFLDIPDSYYDMIADRIPWHQEPLNQLQEEKILIDGEKQEKSGLLLQIFTENIFGPVFFEIIQRKGNEGFGEGNFQALFEAIEQDQIKRGILQEKLS